MLAAYNDIKRELFNAAADIPNRTHPHSVSLNEISRCRTLQFIAPESVAYVSLFFLIQ